MKKLSATCPSATCPFVVAVDGREKAPYTFTGMRTDANKQHIPLIVTTEWSHLKTGDYTIKGFENVIAVERKSLADIFSTLGQHRDRFEEEHRRMAEMRRACVVIESSWYDVMHWPPSNSKLNPKTVWRTSIAWFCRYGVPWYAMEDRRLAELFTFRFLEKSWKEFGADGNGKPDVNCIQEEEM